MASTPVPPHIDQLGERSFSFYPPIVGVDHNEWTVSKTNWSEILVRNSKSGMDVWIPRSYVGEFSKVEEPVMILGLKRELEYKGGSVWPFERRLLNMPAAPSVSKSGPPVDVPIGKGSVLKDTVSALRSGGSGAESSVGRMIGIALVIGIVITVAGIGWFRLRSTGGPIEYRAVLQADLGFTAASDYFDVVRKLGPPGKDQWREGAGERQYRALHYPRNNMIVILMGPDQRQARYIGTKDNQWRTIHAVELPGGRNTEPILRALRRF